MTENEQLKLVIRESTLKGKVDKFNGFYLLTYFLYEQSDKHDHTSCQHINIQT